MRKKSLSMELTFELKGSRTNQLVITPISLGDQHFVMKLDSASKLVILSGLLVHIVLDVIQISPFFELVD